MPSMIEFEALTTPTAGTAPSDIITAIAPALASNYNLATGEATLFLTSDKGLNPPPQKHASMLMSYGVLNSDDAYVDGSLKIIQRTLEFRNSGLVLDGTNGGAGTTYTGDAGSFPGLKFGSPNKFNLLHKKALPLDKFCDALLLFSDSPYNTGARGTLAATLIGQIGECAEWMADSDDLAGFMVGKDKCNQNLSAASFIYKAGVLNGDDAALLAKGQELVEYIFDNRVSVTGIFQEPARGLFFDGNYHMYSADMLARLWLLLPDDAFRTRLFTLLRRGLRRWLATCDWGAGIINATGWSRTDEVLPRITGLTTIGRNIIPLRLHLSKYVLDTGCLPCDLSLVADACINNGGQEFDHIVDDDDDDGEID